jgi:hypothetical protein
LNMGPDWPIKKMKGRPGFGPPENIALCDRFSGSAAARSPTRPGRPANRCGKPAGGRRPISRAIWASRETSRFAGCRRGHGGGAVGPGPGRPAALKAITLPRMSGSSGRHTPATLKPAHMSWKPAIPHKLPYGVGHVAWHGTRCS